MSDCTAENGQQDESSLPADINKNPDNENVEEATSESDSNLQELSKTNYTSFRTKLASYASRMLNVCKEVVLMLVVVLTYAALPNHSPKITKSPTAHPFFPKDSLVTDWYRGQISAAIQQARKADVAFIMFYAPWDAESQRLRTPFLETAEYLSEQVTFSAVNCWQPGSECKSQYSKVYNWPVLIAYPTHTRGIQYNGPHDTFHFIRFLNAISRPLIRVTSHEEVDSLIASYDAVIVGHVNGLHKSGDYGILYTTALRFLEKDPFQEIAFAVWTHPKSQDLPALEFHLWNETLIYPYENEWRPEEIINWIAKHLHQVTMWFTPSGMKSLQLSAYLQPGPALILFTPRNPLWKQVDFYALLREIGLEYYDCDNNSKIRDILQLSIHQKRLADYLDYKTNLRKCSLRSGEKKLPLVVTHSGAKKWLNTSQTCNEHKINSFTQNCEQLSCNCIELQPNLFEGKCATIKEHNPMHSGDKYSAKQLRLQQKKAKCKLHYISEKYQPKVFSESIVDWTVQDNTDLYGAACKTNASLTLIALDSMLFYHFAERLGIDLLKCPDKTAAVILNEKMESHYVMEEPVNDENLRYFIANYTQNTLRRSLQSVTTIKGTITANAKNNTVYMEELNAETFLPTVMEMNKVVVVLYYSKQCFFCNGISHILLSTSNILSSINSIKFTRIDGDLNLLPWEYTMESFPTILLFPARRKSESRIFPRNVPITIKNLINFILVNIENNLKLQIMWSICNETKFKEDRAICIKTVRMEILNLIEHSLHQWRKADTRRKSEVLHLLRHLRNLHLLLAHSPDNSSAIEKYFRKIDG